MALFAPTPRDLSVYSGTQGALQGKGMQLMKMLRKGITYLAVAALLAGPSVSSAFVDYCLQCQQTYVRCLRTAADKEQCYQDYLDCRAYNGCGYHSRS
jgi:hypothetical protein